MNKNQIIILLIATGATLGTILRPGIPEVVIGTIAALAVAWLIQSRKPLLKTSA